MGTQIEGSSVVVTGGASGIGKGLCERFAALGAAHVVVADLNLEAAQAVADAIGGTAVHCDVTDDASVRALIAASIEAMGHIDLFCANAGIGVGGGIDVDDDTWSLTMDVNVMGVIRSARAVIPHMTERGGGTLLITASAAALTTGPVSFNYAVSKHAALGAAEWLALHHGPTIAVSALCPTIVDTPMLPDFGDVIMQPLTVDQVVDSTIEGLEAGSFMITPMPMALDMFRAKANDFDGFHETMRGRLTDSGSKFGP